MKVEETGSLKVELRVVLSVACLADNLVELMVVMKVE